MELSSAALIADVEQSIPELVDVVRESSRRSLELFRTPMKVENKLARGGSESVDYDPVTAADRLVEDLLTAYLRERFPEVGIFGEERGRSGSERLRWVIDPIDGTRAFVTGRPMWGTLVGLEIDAEPVAGFMHVPTLDESYWAVQPRTRTTLRTVHGERVLSTSETTDISAARLASTNPWMFDPGAAQETFRGIADRCQLVRFDGDCYNYALLASGDLDLVIEDQLEPYDISALIPIVKAAGGVVTGPDGGSARRGGYVVAAANKTLHRKALELLS